MFKKQENGKRNWLRRTAAVATAALVGTTALTGVSVGLAATATATPAHAAPSTQATAAHAGTWYETAFATWTGTTAGSYRAFVRLTPGQNAYYWRTDAPIEDPYWDMANGWVEVDEQLIRNVDPHRNTWRVDIPGLPRGTYDVRITTGDDVEVAAFAALETNSFPRLGAAFVPSHELIQTNAANQNTPAINTWAPYGATGGYLSDGRINPDAVVLYVSHQDWDDFTVASLTRGSALRGNNPIVVRFLGTVGDFDSVAPTAQEAGARVPSGAMNNNRMKVLNGNSHEITLEGVGDDATIFGWGIFTGGSSNVVIRNLEFDKFFQFGARANGATSNFWVHHNDFGYGQNRMLFNDEETDRAMGQGAVDIEQFVRGYTIGYNRFYGGRGTHLIIGGVQNATLANNLHRHYGTLHHNLYYGSQERNPRTRHHNLHIFNNIFASFRGNPLHYRLMDRYTAYGIGSAHNATIWAEGNVFDQAGFPFLRSRHGHARGVYPHAGFNHFFGDGPGFMVTGDNISVETGASVGAMAIPAFGADLGYRNAATGLATAEQHADFVTAVGRMQPNVLDAYSASTFDAAVDLGITVDQAATMMAPPADDHETAIGFPGLNGNANNHGWGFDGEFRPSTAPEGIWPTSTPAEAAALRAEVENNAGSQRALAATTTPVAPATVTANLNAFEYMMLRQASPLPALRTITMGDTFTVAWDGEDTTAESHEIGIYRDGAWQVLGSVPAMARHSEFTTQRVTEMGALRLYNTAGEPVMVHYGANGLVVLHPSIGFPGITPEDVPAVEDLVWGPEWVIADVINGGTYQFGVRAVNAAGHSAWATHTVEVAPDQARVYESVQMSLALPGETSVVEFDIRTAGIADGTYAISLSVPRSQARASIPWPTAMNFTGLIGLPGNTLSGNGPVTGNGGVGTLEIVNGVGRLQVEVAGNVPFGNYDLVLTIDGTVVTPFNLTVGEFELPTYEQVELEDVDGFMPMPELPSVDVVGGFYDVTAANPFYAYINWLAGHGIANGWAAEDWQTAALPTFRPGQAITRQAMASFLWNSAGAPIVELPNGLPFVDVPADHPFFDSIAWLYTQGITTGWADGTFRPTANITREATAAFLHRFHGSPEFGDLSGYSFVDTATSPFANYISWLAANGITTGWADGTFRPGASVTREAMAAFLHRAYAGASTQALAAGHWNVGALVTVAAPEAPEYQVDSEESAGSEVEVEVEYAPTYADAEDVPSEAGYGYGYGAADDYGYALTDGYGYAAMD